MELSPQVEQKYTAIIDNILATCDLNTISAKRIRKGLQEALNQDISHQKVPTASCWCMTLSLIQGHRKP